MKQRTITRVWPIPMHVTAQEVEVSRARLVICCVWHRPRLSCGRCGLFTKPVSRHSDNGVEIKMKMLLLLLLALRHGGAAERGVSAWAEKGQSWAPKYGNGKNTLQHYDAV